MWQKNDEFLPVFTTYIQLLGFRANPIQCCIICKHLDLPLLFDLKWIWMKMCHKAEVKPFINRFRLTEEKQPNTSQWIFPPLHRSPLQFSFPMQDSHAPTVKINQLRLLNQAEPGLLLRNVYQPTFACDAALLGSACLMPFFFPEMQNNSGCERAKCCSAFISSRFHFECAYDCRLEYKLILKPMIVHSPQGALLDCLFNYIFNRFPGKQTQKGQNVVRLVWAFKFSNTNYFHYLEAVRRDYLWLNSLLLSFLMYLWKPGSSLMLLVWLFSI